MSDHGKISTAFDAFMADKGANDKREALVIFRAPRDETLPPAPKDPTERLKYVKERSDRQRSVYISFSDSYEFEALRRRVNKRLELTTSSIGSSVFPVAQAEVTSRMLPALAGVAALLMAAHPNATVSDITTALKETARHPKGHQSRPDNRWGYGMIRPKEALGALSS